MGRLTHREEGPSPLGIMPGEEGLLGTDGGGDRLHHVVAPSFCSQHREQQIDRNDEETLPQVETSTPRARSGYGEDMQRDPSSTTTPGESARRREERLVQHVVRIGDAVGDFIEYWGFKRIHGRVWTLLALRSSPMTQSRSPERSE